MLQFGTCIIILRKIYVILILFLIISFGLYLNIKSLFFSTHTYIQTVSKDDAILNKYYDNHHKANITWEELLKECGSQVMIDNSARGNEIFAKKYYKTTVEWKGYFMGAFLEKTIPWGYSDHLVNINVRMIPSESMVDPDLYLSLDTNVFKKYRTLITKELKAGVPIKFKAVIESLGNEWRTHRLHLVALEKTEDFITSEDKITLFHGATFDIVGHKKHEGAINPLNSTEVEEKLKILEESSGNPDSTAENNK